MLRFASPQRLRPQVFSTSRRLDPPRACWPCFMPDPLMGFCPSELCSPRRAVRRLRRRSPHDVGRTRKTHHRPSRRAEALRGDRAAGLFLDRNRSPKPTNTPRKPPSGRAEARPWEECVGSGSRASAETPSRRPSPSRSLGRRRSGGLRGQRRAQRVRAAAEATIRALFANSERPRGRRSDPSFEHRLAMPGCPVRRDAGDTERKTRQRTPRAEAREAHRNRRTPPQTRRSGRAPSCSIPSSIRIAEANRASLGTTRSPSAGRSRRPRCGPGWAREHPRLQGMSPREDPLSCRRLFRPATGA
jgi:hypothetical protein